MTIAEITPASFAEGSVAVTQTTQAVTRTLVADSYLHIIASYDLSRGTPTSITITDNNGNGGTYSSQLDVENDATSGQGCCHFVTTTPTKAGSCVITATCNGVTGGVFALCICVQEIKGSSGQNVHTGNIQASPGTGTDAVTTGNMTPGGQPALVAALAMDSGAGSTTSPSAGTGFTDAGTGWALGTGHDLARAESKRVTSVAAVAGTFTTGTNARFTSLGAVFVEANPGIFFGAGTTS